MVLSQRYKLIQIKMIDGISLEACLYEPASMRPVPIVMSHGVSQQTSIGETAESFQSTGFNILLYDTRSVGSSNGLPRNQIDPVNMVKDVSGTFFYQALLHSIQAQTLPDANPR
ncbi:Alpha/Beta hydrolase protein [Xylariaceae sp. FL1651]|nr:Alpha/Beta hydrolase protein [Xylariaceae sp. FL1651]